MNKANRVLLLIAGIAGSAIIYYLLILPARKASAAILLAEEEADKQSLQNDAERQKRAVDTLQRQADNFFNFYNNFANRKQAIDLQSVYPAGSEPNYTKPAWKRWYKANYWNLINAAFVAEHSDKIPAGFDLQVIQSAYDKNGVALWHPATSKLFTNSNTIKTSI